MLHHHLMLIGSLLCLFKCGIIYAQGPSPAGGTESQFRHTVAVNRQGRRLILEYKLLDPAGHELDLREMAQEPPRFTVYQGDRKLATGQFEFG